MGLSLCVAVFKQRTKENRVLRPRAQVFLILEYFYKAWQEINKLRQFYLEQ